MKKVVVFIDEPSASQAVQEILSARSELQVAIATTAVELAAQCESGAIVLTDLPGSSLDFLDDLRDSTHIALSSVVILTSPQNEHLAVQSLRKGAISYVPLRLLDIELLKTLDTVFSVLHERDNRLRILECMSQWRNKFVLENDSSLIGPLVRYFQEAAERIGLLCQANEATRMGIALEEALLNSMYHGNLEVPSELREEDDSKFFALVESRRMESPYQQRRIVVHSDLSRDQAVFTISDEGPGFDMSSIPDPTDPNNVERVSGRGMLLMRTFMDCVEYNELGNMVTLTKRRQECEPS